MKKSKLTQTEILLLSLIGIIALVYVYETFIGKNYQKSAIKRDKTVKIGKEDYSQKVIPENGVVLPVKWGDLGAQMTSAGVIDKTKFEEMYAKRGGLNDEEKSCLKGLITVILKSPKKIPASF